MLGLWILSLLAAIGTGWLVFARGPAGVFSHATFLLSVGAFVACSLWALARALSKEQPAENRRRNEDRRE